MSTPYADYSRDRLIQEILHKDDQIDHMLTRLVQSRAQVKQLIGHLARIQRSSVGLEQTASDQGTD